MYPLINFDNWTIDEDSPYGSGASEKHWLLNVDSKKRGIFKFPKTKDDNTITGEYWAEKLAAEIAVILGLESARVDIGTFNNRKGSMSYMLLDDNEELIEGIQYISKYYPNYDGDKFEDLQAQTVYSIQMIMHSLNDFVDLKNQFLKIPMFDCLIGNSDRHHSNWAVIKSLDTGELRISPVYDNGSSLCCYVNPEKTSAILSNSQQFEALVNGKSKSLIGWESSKRPRHFDLYKNIVENFFIESEKFILKLENNLTDTSIDDLLKNFEEDIINDELKLLIKRFLVERRDRMVSIFNKSKEANYE